MSGLIVIKYRYIEHAFNASIFNRKKPTSRQHARHSELHAFASRLQELCSTGSLRLRLHYVKHNANSANPSAVPTPSQCRQAQGDSNPLSASSSVHPMRAARSPRVESIFHASPQALEKSIGAAEVTSASYGRHVPLRSEPPIS